MLLPLWLNVSFKVAIVAVMWVLVALLWIVTLKWIHAKLMTRFRLF